MIMATRVPELDRRITEISPGVVSSSVVSTSVVLNSPVGPERTTRTIVSPSTTTHCTLGSYSKVGREIVRARSASRRLPPSSPDSRTDSSPSRLTAATVPSPEMSTDSMSPSWRRRG